MKKEEEKNVDINEAEILETCTAFEYEREPKPIKKKKVVRRKKKICKNAVDINQFRAENVKQYQKNVYNIQRKCISQELANFMGIIHQGTITTLTQQEVTRYLIEYIKTQSLSDPRNRRRINPDAKLQSLLKIPVGEQLTFLNLQKYLRPHLF